MLHMAALEDVTVGGQLRARAEKNLRRLHDPEFHFAATIKASTAREAPGDWVGREILALTLHARLFRETPSHLEEFIARLPEALNARGYIGEIHPAGTADENQLGGHNALLRGLSEYFLWRGDARALAVIRSVVAHLMVPVRPLLAQYPDKAMRQLVKSEAVGLTVRQADGPWRGLSTDIGTLFFTLDGLTQAYLCERRPELRALIEAMIDRYTRIDPLALGAQTHATLTTLRGILRWWRDVDPAPRLLALVRERFQLYRAHAQTEHHANFNWFGRPEWTEACAVVDSFQLAVQLWAATADAELLEEAHRIYYNAFLHAQRPNGGFGCDVCVGANGENFLSAHKIFEAPFCCSMRAAEGFATAATAAWWDNGSDALTLPFCFGGSARVHLAEGDLVFAQETEYPLGGRVKLKLTRGRSPQPVALRFFAPTWSPPESFRIARNGHALDVAREPRFAVVRTPLAVGDEVVAEFDLNAGPIDLQNPARQPGAKRYAHGPLLLGREVNAGAAAKLTPLPALVDLSESEARTRRTRVIFPAGSQP